VDSRRSIWQVIGVLGGARPSAVPDVCTEATGDSCSWQCTKSKGCASTRDGCLYSQRIVRAAQHCPDGRPDSDVTGVIGLRPSGGSREGRQNGTTTSPVGRALEIGGTASWDVTGDEWRLSGADQLLPQPAT
jgi:hypothetical protein